VETATMVPSGVIGVMAELYRIRTQPPEGEAPEVGEGEAGEP